jgi:creatinine amidohydrolase
MQTWIPPERNFAYLTWKQVEALPKDDTLLVLPTTAIEQHGHHLPLATDTLINNLLLGHALQRIPAHLSIYALPPFCYGKSNEHLGFPGTMTLSAATFMSVVRDIGASVAASGIKKLVLYNTHGGNTALDDVLCRDLRAEFGLRTFYLSGSGGAPHEGLTPQEHVYGFHAGEWETSVMLYADPKLVHIDKYTTNYIAHVDKPELLKPEFAPATFSWLTRDIAPSGVMGDPTPSTTQKGKQWVEEAAEKVAEALCAMLRYENHYKP